MCAGAGGGGGGGGLPGRTAGGGRATPRRPAPGSLESEATHEEGGLERALQGPREARLDMTWAARNARISRKDESEGLPQRLPGKRRRTAQVSIPVADLRRKGNVSNACCMLVLHAGKRSSVTTQAAGPSHARDGPPSSESPWIRVIPCASIRVGPLPRSSDPHPSHRGGSESWGKQADPGPPFLRRLAGPKRLIRVTVDRILIRVSDDPTHDE